MIQVEPSAEQCFTVTRERDCIVLRLTSDNSTNTLGLACVTAVHAAVQQLKEEAENGGFKGLILTGNERFFSAGADLNEIAQLTGADALEFSRLGQALMRAIDHFPVPVFAAIRGYCMGGGMDLALACDFRIAAPNADRKSVV